MRVRAFKINRDPGRERPAWAIEEERQKEAKRQDLALNPMESCQVGCVGELYTVEHYEEALAYASLGGGQTLVVIDFWKPECGMCQYLLPIFKKVCKSETGAEADADSDDRALFSRTTSLTWTRRSCRTWRASSPSRASPSSISTRGVSSSRNSAPGTRPDSPLRSSGTCRPPPCQDRTEPLDIIG